MKSYSALTLTFALFFVATVLPSAISAQENPAKQQAFDSGPAGAYLLSASSGPGAGQVSLTWKQTKGEVKNYHVVYGTAPNSFQYSALNVDGNVATGGTISFTVSYLNPGTRYYFALSPIIGGKPQALTLQVAGVAKPGVVVPPSQPTTSSSLNPVAADSFQNQSKDNIKQKGVGLHQLSVQKTKGSEVTLNWKHAFSDTDNYDIVYGTEPGKFQYGALNVGKTTTFTVKDLDPNKNYYFALVPVKGNKAQYITQQASESPSGGSQPSGSANTSSGATSGSSGGSSSTTTTSGGSTTTTSGSGSQTSTSAPSSTDTTKKSKDKVKGAETENVGILEWILNLLNSVRI